MAGARPRADRFSRTLPRDPDRLSGPGSDGSSGEPRKCRHRTARGIIGACRGLRSLSHRQGRFALRRWTRIAASVAGKAALSGDALRQLYLHDRRRCVGDQGISLQPQAGVFSGWAQYPCFPLRSTLADDALRAESRAEWNRGAYLVEALEHCGECHTPRNLFQALDNRLKFAGAVQAGWRAIPIPMRRLPRS